MCSPGSTDTPPGHAILASNSSTFMPNPDGPSDGPARPRAGHPLLQSAVPGARGGDRARPGDLRRDGRDRPGPDVQDRQALGGAEKGGAWVRREPAPDRADARGPLHSGAGHSRRRGRRPPREGELWQAPGRGGAVRGVRVVRPRHRSGHDGGAPPPDRVECRGAVRRPGDGVAGRPRDQDGQGASTSGHPSRAPR